MERLFFTSLICIVLVACNSGQADKVKRAGEPAIYSVQDSDEEMNHAVQTAKQTLSTFDNAIQSGNPDYQYFALKSRFETEAGGEHIWMSGIALREGKYFGVVDNLPENTQDVKVGDTIEIALNTISDWMYIDNGVLRGGYTIRLLRNRMTEEERKAFDAENGLIIED